MWNATIFRNEDNIVQFCLGLNEQNQGVRSYALLIDPLWSIYKVCFVVLWKESQQSYDWLAHLEEDLVEEEDMMVFKGEGGKGNSSKVYTYCGKLSHTIYICYKKHGLLKEI